MIDLFGQAAKIPDPVAIAVVEGFDVQLIDNGILVPEQVLVGLLSMGGLHHVHGYAPCSYRTRQIEKGKCGSSRRCCHLPVSENF